MTGRAPRGARVLAGVAVAVALGAGTAAAQTRGDDRPAYDHASAPSLAAGRVTASITIDGRLDEPDWAATPAATGFRQRDPSEGTAASERTEVRILVGDGAIVVGARMRDADPSAIVTRVGPRSGGPDFDWFLVYFDPFHDHLRSVWFSVNPSCERTEAVLTDAGVHDHSWDPVWEAECRIDDEGWVAEMRIPLSQIRYDPRVTTWGFQTMRGIHRKQELDWWAFTPKSEPEGTSRFGHLTGLEGLPEARALEATPYGSLRSERLADGTEDGPEPRVGLDLKARPVPSLTLEGTVNPDFGQVEVDPAVVNLTAFETFFPERRPFFVEGAEIFDFSRLSAYSVGFGHDVFYSRRIGRPPQRTPSGDADPADLPEETTIAAAVKGTVRTPSGWSVGAIDAWTLAERVEVGGVDVALEPATNHAVARVRRDFAGGDAAIGGIVTRVDRVLDDPGLADLLRERATVVGLDAERAWGNREWIASGFAAWSRVSGSAAAIDATQRSSARYLQRPDAVHLDHDPSRTRLDGHTWQLALQKASGERWTGSVAWQSASPGYETNDLGFLSTTDRRALSGSLRYREDEPGRWLRRWDVALVGLRGWTFGDERIADRIGLSGTFLTPGYATVTAEAHRAFERDDDRLTRGGPLARAPAGWWVSGGYASDARGGWTWSVHGSREWDAGGGRTTELLAETVLRPTPASRITIGPRWTRRRDPAQFVAAVDDPTATGTFGTRHLFATLDQTTVSAEARVAWGFGPELGVEAYGQVLLAGNEHGPIKEFVEPGGYDFAVYGVDRGTADRVDGAIEIDPDGPGGEAPAFVVDDPAFGSRSFRGNLVLRWEFRPGSTLHAVYQHGRERTDALADLDVGRDLDRLFGEPASHVVVVKASWWLDL